MLLVVHMSLDIGKGTHWLKYHRRCRWYVDIKGNLKVKSDNLVVKLDLNDL